MNYDYVVIGAGSAGSIIATRLTEDPNVSVLLLEAGPDYPDFERLPEEVKYGYSTEIDLMVSDHNWQFIAKATESAPPMMVPRGKVTGGSSAINGQVFLRGVPEDYDSWAEAGNSEWKYTDCLPYFRKLETDSDFSDDFHGTDGPIVCHRFKPETWHPAQAAFYAACREAGFPHSTDHNNPDSTGVGATPFNNPGGIRMSTALGYLDQGRHRLNLTIRPNCHVQKILFEDGAKGSPRAVGARVESGGEVFEVYGNEIILSSGAVGSPHILMLSGIGPAAHLQEFGIPVVADLPGVGQNLRDHPLIFVTWRTKPEIPLDVLAPRMQVSLRYTADGSPLRNDMKMSMQSFATGRVDRMEPVGIRITSGIQLAAGAGELRLQSADPAEQPLLDYRYLQDPFDLERLRDTVRLCVRLGESEAFKEVIDERIEPTDAELATDEALDEYLFREVTTSQHISCTARMGPADDPMAVVSQYGRVHGVEGLRVADASIMPDCIRANTNVTTMMIGERMAEFIKAGRYGEGLASFKPGGDIPRGVPEFLPRGLL